MFIISGCCAYGPYAPEITDTKENAKLILYNRLKYLLSSSNIEIDTMPLNKNDSEPFQNIINLAKNEGINVAFKKEFTRFDIDYSDDSFDIFEIFEV